jgi:hypothetical protein
MVPGGTKINQLMCIYSQHIILTEIENAQISWCKGCRSYSLIFNSCAMSFTKSELEQFKEVLASLTEADFHYDFLGERQVLLKNQFGYMGICLTQRQVYDLEQLVAEALEMNEVFQIIYR